MHRPARRIFEATRTASNLLSRQIDIQSNLPLRTIAERRRLVDALQKYGEVATFLPARDGNHTRILAIYDSAEAATKAINASPLTISLPRAASRLNTTTTHDDDDDVVNDNVHVTCTVGLSKITLAEHDKRISENPWNAHYREDTFDCNHSDIKNDARIADLIATKVPRQEFADAVIDTSNLRSDHVEEEDRQNRIDGTHQHSTALLKGSLLALVQE